MPGPLLESKLRLPRPQRDLVQRARLLERLDRGTASTLTLVSAPAGFGKTTLLAAWLRSSPAGDPRSVAWLSLDRDDDDPAQFWTAVIAALASVAPGFGAREAELLRAPRPAIREALTGLLNELSALDREVVLVLDDYHAVDSLEVRDGMTFLLDHLPPRVHLIIATRADPALPLARLRARGELLEVRAADLRFTAEEASAYLTDVMALSLAPQELTALAGRTEGWIAALQLAALSIRGRDDVPEFIAAFSGNDRYIVDYLVDEVLQSRPEPVVTFLLETAILERMTGGLCDAVTGQGGGRATLEALDRANLFLVPLDDDRRWYRYHRLFADVLQARLADERPERVPGLHRRASSWFALHDQPAAAIQHALAAADPELAAGLVETVMPAMLRERREATLLSWLERLPDDVVRVRPVLSVGYAGALLAAGQVHGVESHLRDAERCPAAGAQDRSGPEAGAPGFVVVDAEEFARLPAAIAVYRAGLALALGDAVTTVTRATQALGLLHEDDHVQRAAAAALLGLASWGRGDLDAAYDAYVECSASLRRAGFIVDVLGCATTLADIRITQGRLRAAMRVYEQALQLASEQPHPVPRGLPDLHVGMSTIHLEWGDLDSAKEHLLRSAEGGESAGMPRYRYRSRVAAAAIQEADGDASAAIDLLDEAEREYVADFAPDVRPIAAVRARVWLVQGRVDRALAWAREQHLSADDDLSYLHEFEHVTLARSLLAQHEQERSPSALGAATGLLSRLLAAAESGGRTGTAIEVLVLLAVAHRYGGDLPAASLALQHAVRLAEPEGYVRVFADAGASITDLLKAATRVGVTGPSIRRLRSAVSGQDGAGGGPMRGVTTDLSEREREVLRLLGTDLSGPEIARRLVVSLNTVRTHTKNIYAKLGVTSRRAAVLRGEDLARSAPAPSSRR